MADRASATTDALTESSVSVIDKVIDFCNHVLDCNITVSDISIAHALPVKAASNQPAAVIVRFVRRSVRDKVFSSRHKLKTYITADGNKIYINEDLTANNRKILVALRLKVHNHVIGGAWVPIRTHTGQGLASCYLTHYYAFKSPDLLLMPANNYSATGFYPLSLMMTTKNV